jgi:hypothetical protein
MTTTDTQAEYLQVPATANERLSQLHAAYAAAKTESDEAAARLKVVTDGIKLELLNLAPEERKLALSGPDGPTLTLTHSRSARFDSTKFKREDPETYASYAKFSDSWTLKAVKGGASE